MSNSIKNKIIIWSIDDFNTLGLLRALGHSGTDLLFLVLGKAGYAVKSKYCMKYIITQTVQEGFEYLINDYHSESYKPIIIISNDEIVSFVDVHRDELNERFILPVTREKGNTIKYIDKITMTSLAEELGILCPKSKKFQWDSSTSDVEYPCLIKPSHQTQGHFNEFKFKICKNERTLKHVLKFVRRDSEFILQQYIPKELDLLIYGGRMMDGKTILAGAMIRDRWADSGSSSHGYLTKDIPKCVDVEKISEFLKKIDYYGLFSFEYGMVGHQAYFFEVNLRNDGTSHYFLQAGANIPLAYVYSCAGLDYSIISTTINGKKWFIDELFDIENVIKRNISKKQWKRDLEEATVFKYYDSQDPEPWIYVKKIQTKQIVKDFILKRFRLYIVFILDKISLRKKF